MLETFRRTRFVALFILLLSSQALGAWPNWLSLRSWCNAVVGAFGPPIPDPEGWGYAIIDQPTVRPIVNLLYRYSVEAGEPLPQVYPFFLSTEKPYDAQSAALGPHWFTAIPRDGLPRHDDPSFVVKKHPLKDSAEVWQVSVDGKTQFFRPIEDGRPLDVREARYTMNASRVAQRLGSRFVPKSSFAYVNGKLGVLSEEAPGEQAPMGFMGYFEPLTPVSAESLAEGKLIEFLLGNKDVHYGNYAVEPDGTTRVFDHGKAFYPGIPPSEPYPFGTGLPEKYPTKLVAKLREIDETAWREFFAGELTDIEIQGFLIRRQVILLDAELKGQ